MRRKTQWSKALVVTTLGAGLLGSFLACQQYVFSTPESRGCRTVEVPRKIEIQRAADILFIVDNSGSMQEEQDNLAKNSSSLCDVGETCTNPCGTEEAVSNLKKFMTDGPGHGIPVEQWPAQLGSEGTQFKNILENCGFIERLQLYDNDFQIGIITTDDEEKDGTLHTPDGGTLCPNGREGLPMRGCLLTEPNPPAGRRVISPRDGTIGTISRRFRNAIKNVGICGAAFEEGLDSMKAFLDPDTERAAESCNQDLSTFLRTRPCKKLDGGMQCQTDTDGKPILDESAPTPKLVVIILSDEEDCSHYDPGDPTHSTIDETRRGDTDRCYTDPEALRPVAEYVRFLKSLKAEDPTLISVATIVGGNKDATGQFVGGDCRCNATEAGAAPQSACMATHGNSTSELRCGIMEANQFCGRLATHFGDGGVVPEACCTADHGNRYAEFAQGMSVGNYLMNSICEQDYRDTMIAIANLINETGVVPLGETPASPRQLQVEVKRTAGGDWEPVQPFSAAFSSTPRSTPEYLSCTGCPCTLPDGGVSTNCQNLTVPGGGGCQGYSLVDNCRTVKFHGSAVPPSGAEIRVSFLGGSLEDGPVCAAGAQ